MPLHQPGIPEHAVDAGRADGHHVGIEHHERQAGDNPQGDGSSVEGDDRLLFPVLEPPVAGDPALCSLTLP